MKRTRFLLKLADGLWLCPPALRADSSCSPSMSFADAERTARPRFALGRILGRDSQGGRGSAPRPGGGRAPSSRRWLEIGASSLRAAGCAQRQEAMWLGGASLPEQVVRTAGPAHGGARKGPRRGRRGGSATVAGVVREAPRVRRGRRAARGAELIERSGRSRGVGRQSAELVWRTGRGPWSRSAGRRAHVAERPRAVRCKSPRARRPPRARSDRPRTDVVSGGRWRGRGKEAKDTARA